MHLFEKISDQDLLQKTITLVKEERRVGIEVLKHLAEVERRSLHLREGCIPLGVLHAGVGVFGGCGAPAYFEHAAFGIGS